MKMKKNLELILLIINFGGDHPVVQLGVQVH